MGLIAIAIGSLYGYSELLNANSFTRVPERQSHLRNGTRVFLLIVLLCYPYVSLSGRDTYGLTLKINTDDGWIKENKSNVPAFLPAA
jgi:hypothetical protein